MYVCKYVCMNRLIFLTYKTYLEPQKLVIFIQLCHINHKNCTGSSNLFLMILGDTFNHNSHFMGKRLSPHPQINYIIIF